MVLGLAMSRLVIGLTNIRIKLFFVSLRLVDPADEKKWTKRWTL